MTTGLKRYQHTGDLHFVTFSCYRRQPFLHSLRSRRLFEAVLEKARLKYRFLIVGYVVMPEHVHLLLSEPPEDQLSGALKSLKLSMSKLSPQRPFWQARYYDFNVYTERKRVEKLEYMHRNPVKRGLVENPEDWPSSSCRHYLTGKPCSVRVESWWVTSKSPG